MAKTVIRVEYVSNEDGCRDYQYLTVKVLADELADAEKTFDDFRYYLENNNEDIECLGCPFDWRGDNLLKAYHADYFCIHKDKMTKAEFVKELTKYVSNYRKSHL